MDTMVRLDELLGRASKISDGQAIEAATLLLSFYSETQDKAKVANYLMKFKWTVCLSFFEAAIKTLDPDTQIQSLHAAICSTDAYRNNKNHVATSRGFIITAILIKNRISFARAVLMRTLADVEKDGKFSETVINNFKQYVVEYCGGIDSIKVLGDKEWKNKETHNRFVRFLQNYSNSIVTIISPPKTQDGCDVSITPTAPSVSASPLPTEEKRVAFFSENDVVANVVSLAEGILKVLSNASTEANILLKSLSDKNGTIALLRKDISDRDSRIEEL